MTSPIPPDLASKIEYWRAAAANGTLTREDTKEFVTLLRAGRMAAAQASASAKRTKAIKEIPHADDLLGDL